MIAAIVIQLLNFVLDCDEWVSKILAGYPARTFIVLFYVYFS